MASLRNVVKENKDELRDGIAWVVFWKEGRSWSAEAFWLESSDDTLCPEDKLRLEKIQDIDPSAVVLNGYYCGYLGEEMNGNDLTAGVRWHYENGANDIASFIDEHERKEVEAEESQKEAGELPKEAGGLPGQTGVKKTYWCVTSFFYNDGIVQAAISSTVEAFVKPETTFISTSTKDIYKDWFDSRKMAERFVNELKVTEEQTIQEPTARRLLGEVQETGGQAEKVGALIVPLPESCADCQYAQGYLIYYCKEKRSDVGEERIIPIACMNGEGRPDWCPIRAVPSNLNLCGEQQQPLPNTELSYRLGWNTCRDAVVYGVPKKLPEKEKEPSGPIAKVQTCNY